MFHFYLFFFFFVSITFAGFCKFFFLVLQCVFIWSTFRHLKHFSSLNGQQILRSRSPQLKHWYDFFFSRSSFSFLRMPWTWKNLTWIFAVLCFKFIILSHSSATAFNISFESASSFDNIRNWISESLSPVNP